MLKKYFVRGLILITPIGITSLIIIALYGWIIDQLNLLDLHGISLILAALAVLGGITFLGYIGSNILIKPIANTIESVIEKIPLVSFIYTAIKDLSAAFMGDKKKFDQPVLVALDKDNIVKKPGFITRKDLSELGLSEYVAVYLPHSYNFSGNVFIIKSSHVERIDNSSSGEFMKFIVSGGISGQVSK